MTDIDTPPEVVDTPPEVDVPDGAPFRAAEEGKVPCQFCGRYYGEGPGMARHLTLAHPGERMDTQDTQCPECGKWLTGGSLTRHRRKVHGVYVGRRRPGRPPGSKNQHLPVAAPRTVRQPVGSNLNPLTADQITTAAAISLFPHGVPTRKLTIMLRWHEATQAFLREVTKDE